jgi:hypothetical protein
MNLRVFLCLFKRNQTGKQTTHVPFQHDTWNGIVAGGDLILPAYARVLISQHNVEFRF